MSIKMFSQVYFGYEIIYSKGMTFKVPLLRPLRGRFDNALSDEEKLGILAGTKGINKKDVPSALLAFRHGSSYESLKLHRIEVLTTCLRLHLSLEDGEEEDDERATIQVNFEDSTGYVSLRNASTDERYDIDWRDGRLFRVTEEFNRVSRSIYPSYTFECAHEESLGSCKVIEQFPILNK